MFERFTDRARRSLVLAQEEATLLGHNFIGTEHLLLGLIHEGEGVAAKALQSLGVDLDKSRSQVAEINPPVPSSKASAPYTPRAKKVLEFSLREALQLGHNYIGTEHMLLGLLREGEGLGAQMLVTQGHDLARVRETVVGLLKGYDRDDAVPTWSVVPAEQEYLVEIDWGIGRARYKVKDSDRVAVAERLESVAAALRR